MIVYLILGVIVIFFLGYRFYGGFLVKQFGAEDDGQTPAWIMSPRNRSFF
jgi:carbon starvation protein CstA